MECINAVRGTVQMDAVTGDHGVWDDPADYFRSSDYRNRPGALALLMYRLVVGFAGRRVARMRRECATGLCFAPARAAR